MLTRKNLELDVRAVSSLGINVYKQTGAKRRPISLFFKRSDIIKEIKTIRDGIHAGKEDAVYDFCDSCIFKKRTLLRGLDIKKHADYVCPRKLCKELNAKPLTKAAFVQRLDILHTYLATTG